MAQLSSFDGFLTITIYTFFCPICRRYYEDRIDDEELAELDDITRECPDCLEEPIFNVLPFVQRTARA